jgi:hypothetical protein
LLELSSLSTSDEVIFNSFYNSHLTFHPGFAFTIKQS